MTKPHLPIAEWMAVLAIIFFLATLTICIILAPQQESTYATTTPHYLVDQQIEVSVEGAVERAGIYISTRGTRLGEFLEKISLKPEADLKRLKLDSKLRAGQKIKIPQIKTITIKLSGAVDQPGLLVVPKGTRMQDLLEKVSFQKDADLSLLRRRRLLKEGENIYIPLTAPE